jgi:large subunit ribosomal protein L3|tara:strand:- start:1907 stop:2545 length:639 start_codon:yes stop_codon:yes gene_type:complete
VIGLIATKEGMTRLFQEDGKSLPVSVLKVATNFVSQIKTKETDGYNSVQLSTQDQKEKNQTKSKIGHFNKNNISLKKYLKEFKIEDDDLEGLELGKEFDVKIFEEGQLVDVSGISKGKGFAGTVKRWNFATQDATHGNSLAHRKPGSIGQCQTPGRVWKGKKMAGHMGNVKKTVQNLKIVKVDEENSLLLVQGAIPGFNGSSVIIKPAIKAK